MRTDRSLAVLCLLGGCIAPHSGAALNDRLRAWEHQLQQIVESRASPSGDDLDLVVAAGIDPSDLPATYVARLGAVLRFGGALGEGEWTPANDYAASRAGLA